MVYLNKNQFKVFKKLKYPSLTHVCVKSSAKKDKTKFVFLTLVTACLNKNIAIIDGSKT